MQKIEGVIKDFKINDTQMQQLLDKHDSFYKDTLAEISTIDNFSIKHILESIMTNLQKYFYTENKPKVWIEKTTSTELYALDLKEIFPNAKFIHLIRDPRDNWASLKSGWEDKYNKYNDDLNRLMQSLIERGKLGLEFAKSNHEILGDNCYKIVKYEDLTTNPEKVMSELSEFVGIEFSDNLLYPTRLGVSWAGNNFDGAKFKKASSENVNRWKERISIEEVNLIEFHFENIMNYFNYSLVSSTRERVHAAKEHYKWFNFSTPFSAK